jgi:hypothetical protein
MNWLELILAIVIVICVVAIAVVLYNFMLLLSELNKRLIYVITDILGNIDLATPHLDTLNPVPENTVEDIVKEETEGSYFNPHEFDVDAYKESNEETNY